jgi:hypothetical protein
VHRKRSVPRSTVTSPSSVRRATVTFVVDGVSEPRITESLSFRLAAPMSLTVEVPAGLRNTIRPSLSKPTSTGTSWPGVASASIRDSWLCEQAPTRVSAMRILSVRIMSVLN